MPGFDKTGPQGQGSMTGKGFGPCSLRFGWRRKFGAGHGRGRYFGCWNIPPTKEDKLKALGDYKKALQEELDDVQKEEKEVGQSD